MAKYRPVIWINFGMDSFRRSATSKVDIEMDGIVKTLRREMRNIRRQTKWTEALATAGVSHRVSAL